MKKTLNRSWWASYTAAHKTIKELLHTIKQGLEQFGPEAIYMAEVGESVLTELGLKADEVGAVYPLLAGEKTIGLAVEIVEPAEEDGYYRKVGELPFRWDAYLAA